MTDLLRTTLAHRGTFAPDTLLDCLALAAELEPRIVQDNGARLVTLAELLACWRCRSEYGPQALVTAPTWRTPFCFGAPGCLMELCLIAWSWPTGWGQASGPARPRC